VYYHPTEEGVEKRIKARLEEIKEAKKRARHGGNEDTAKNRSKNSGEE
jgi:hypothetical protein